jgi:hypothetical protein
MIMRTSPVHPSNNNEAIAMMRATAASRNVGTNGQGLGAGEVIGDSFVSHPEGSVRGVVGVPHDTQHLQGAEGLFWSPGRGRSVLEKEGPGPLEPPIFEMRKLMNFLAGEDA